MLYWMASDGAGASASGGLWVAPADRPRGRRGLRAWLACATALASLAAFAASRLGSGGSGAGGFGGAEFRYELDGPAWARYALVAIACGLLVAAGLLWAARHRATLIAALVAIPPLVVGGLLVEIALLHAGRVTDAEAKAVHVGASEDELGRRLGDPAGHATWRRRGSTLSCKVYVGDAYTFRAGGRTTYTDHHKFFFCLDDGRIAVRESW
jgi:hypothetical protein